MKENIFANISPLKILGALLAFPAVIQVHIFNITLDLIHDVVWTILISYAITMYIMAVIYHKLFFGFGWWDAIQSARGSIILILFLSLVVLLVTVNYNESIDKLYHAYESHEKSLQEIRETLIDDILIPTIETHGFLFVSLLAFASLSSIVNSEDW